MKPVCLITGGASGLGREIVAALSPNYQVVILDLESNHLPVVARKFNADYSVCDVSEYSSISTAIKKYPQIDILINCAGVYLDGELMDNDPEKIRNTLLVNSLGPINTCRAVVPIMKKQKQGIIININSLAGLRPRKLCSVYHASKYALTGFTQSLSLELEPYGIKVTNIYPDLINTGFSKKGNIKRNFTKALDPAQVVGIISLILKLPQHTLVTDLSLKYI